MSYFHKHLNPSNLFIQKIIFVAKPGLVRVFATPAGFLYLIIYFIVDMC